jgi:Fe2+ or Zn2+ uptake regulation protein
MKSGPERTVKREEVLDVMLDNKDDEYEPWTVMELDDFFDANAESIRRRLKELQELGKVKTKKVGSRARVWWIPAYGR